MRVSIQWKIIGIYLSIVLVIMIASGSFIILKIEDQYFKRVKSSIESTAISVRDLLWIEGVLDFETDRESMVDTLKNLINVNEDVDIYILDGNGYVQIALGKAFTRGDYVPTNHPNGFTGVVNQTVNLGVATTTEWRYFVTDKQSTVEHALPIKSNNEEMYAIIYVITGTAEIYNNVDEVMSTLGMGTMLALALAGVFSAMFSRMITQPIKALTTSAKMLVEGAFQKIPIASNDEIGQLTQSFNFMAFELRRSMLDMSSEKNKLGRILENLADGVMAFNRQGVLIHANSVCYDMLGKTKIDHRFDYIFPKFGLNISFDSIITSDIHNKKGTMMEVDDKYINLHFAPYESSHGEIEGLTVVMQDVTSQQKLDQMRKDFVANVSHELRTPLTTVKSYTETLLSGAIEDKDLALNFLGVMEKETDRMTNLVQDLLELSRIDNKQMSLTMHVVDVGELIEETVEAQHLQASVKGQKILLEYVRSDDYLIEGDSARLRQIFHNIVSNAIKYTPNSGKIIIKLLHQDNKVIIKVADSGIGISKQDLERIFERFYRADKARSRQMGGTGLGLSIAKEMVELHGGTIEINSALGRGTEVTMTFSRLELDFD
ncbi:MAG: hypothetical protein ATN35_03090 [Epulopiscium sp. Nele67-Bin004]|nr:MAG: hypothetical protein ATN35_03090 [Epulopiscium sp. Nele67-Bin004]